jgi:hypothetical protein
MTIKNTAGTEVQVTPTIVVASTSALKNIVIQETIDGIVKTYIEDGTCAYVKNSTYYLWDSSDLSGVDDGYGIVPSLAANPDGYGKWMVSHVVLKPAASDSGKYLKATGLNTFGFFTVSTGGGGSSDGYAVQALILDADATPGQNVYDNWTDLYTDLSALSTDYKRSVYIRASTNPIVIPTGDYDLLNTDVIGIIDGTSIPNVTFDAGACFVDANRFESLTLYSNSDGYIVKFNNSNELVLNRVSFGFGTATEYMIGITSGNRSVTAETFSNLTQGTLKVFAGTCNLVIASGTTVANHSLGAAVGATLNLVFKDPNLTVGTVFTDLNGTVNDTLLSAANKISYDNSLTSPSIGASTVQEAIDALKSGTTSIYDGDVTGSTTKMVVEGLKGATLSVDYGLESNSNKTLVPISNHPAALVYNSQENHTWVLPSLLRVDGSNNVTKFFISEINSPAGGVSVDDFIYLFGNNEIYRINSNSGELTNTCSLPNSVIVKGLTHDPDSGDGYLWASNSDGYDGYKISLTDFTYTNVSFGMRTNAIAYSDGYVWAGSYEGLNYSIPGRLVKVNAVTNSIVATVNLSGGTDIADIRVQNIIGTDLYISHTDTSYGKICVSTVNKTTNAVTDYLDVATGSSVGKVYTYTDGSLYYVYVLNKHLQIVHKLGGDLSFSHGSLGYGYGMVDFQIDALGGKDFALMAIPDYLDADGSDRLLNVHDGTFIANLATAYGLREILPRGKVNGDLYGDLPYPTVKRINQFYVDNSAGDGTVTPGSTLVVKETPACGLGRAFTKDNGTIAIVRNSSKDIIFFNTAGDSDNLSMPSTVSGTIKGYVEFEDKHIVITTTGFYVFNSNKELIDNYFNGDPQHWHLDTQNRMIWFTLSSTWIVYGYSIDVQSVAITFDLSTTSVSGNATNVYWGDQFLWIGTTDGSIVKADVLGGAMTVISASSAGNIYILATSNLNTPNSINTAAKVCFCNNTTGEVETYTYDTDTVTTVGTYGAFTEGTKLGSFCVAISAVEEQVAAFAVFGAGTTTTLSLGDTPTGVAVSGSSIYVPYLNADTVSRMNTALVIDATYKLSSVVEWRALAASELSYNDSTVSGVTYGSSNIQSVLDTLKRGFTTVKSIVFADSPYTIANESMVFVNTTGGAITVNLPTSPVTGRTIIVKDSGNGATNNVTVSALATIDGSLTYVIDNGYGSVTLVYTGSSWSVV